jgi:hypothetical protein
MDKVAQVNLANERDTFYWNIHKSKKFNVYSIYQARMDQDVSFNHKLMWNLKVPLKIKIFLWYLQQGLISIKNNSAKRKWKGSGLCCFCNSNEIVQHIFDCCRYPKTGVPLTTVRRRYTHAATSSCVAEREMCPWAISKYFGD